MKSRIRRIGAIAVLCLALPGGALALDSLTLTATSGGADLEQDLRDASLLISLKREGTSDPQELLAAARVDYERLVAVLYDVGRFGGVVSIRVDGREAADIPPLDAPGSIGTIAIAVDPGPVYSFSKARIAPTAPGTELPEGFVAGSPARTGTLRGAVSAGVEGWRQASHAKAAVAGQDLVVDHAADTLAADIALAPGPAATFGKLIPEGFVRVRPSRIVQIAGLPTGEPFDPDAVGMAATRLRRTGAFASVALTEAETLGPGDVLPVTALVAEAKPRRIGFGAEVSSVDGITVSGFWLHRNLLGGAERLRIEGEVAQIGTASGEDYSIGLEFGRPGTVGPDTDLYLTATLEQLNEPSFTTQTGEVEVGLSRALTPDLTVKTGLGYRFSRIGDSTGTDIFRLITLPLQATYDRRDNTLNPTGGVFADVELTPFVGLANADNGARLTFDTRYYRGIGADSRVVLAGRLQGGSVIGASAARVPDDDLFFSGGGGTVRGQSYQVLGVPTAAGGQTGGLSFLGVQAEARVAITSKIGAVAFYDWASVSADALPGSAGQSHAGAGLGLRYDTPVGPVRLDVAAPVSGPGKQGDVKIYIGIGQAF